MLPHESNENVSLHNPWLELPQESPYVLSIDRGSIARRNARVAAEHRINDGSIPEPFIGNPEIATVILLNLNPGDSPQDQAAHRDPAFRRALIRNLRHETQDYPFYPLNPEFAWTPCANWWNMHLRALFDVGGLDRRVVAQRLCVVEWFPYHSRKAGLPNKQVCPSQSYSFEIAKKALEARKIIVGMRARKKWANVHKDFAGAPYLRSTQSGYISPGNTDGDLFTGIVEALRKTSRNGSH
jgi:hypothetical protein